MQQICAIANANELWRSSLIGWLTGLVTQTDEPWKMYSVQCTDYRSTQYLASEVRHSHTPLHAVKHPFSTFAPMDTTKNTEDVDNISLISSNCRSHRQLFTRDLVFKSDSVLKLDLSPYFRTQTRVYILRTWTRTLRTRTWTQVLIAHTQDLVHCRPMMLSHITSCIERACLRKFSRHLFS